ncbi:MAG: DUF2232 domain-containing protein [Bacillaceae bacterium]|nr:DUF2232 domain-containing protein [Bacillaceae bacterium]
MLGRNNPSFIKSFFLISIYFFMLFMALFVPFGFGFMLFLGVPFIIYTVRYSWKHALIAGFAALWISLIIGNAIILFISFFYISIGITMGLLYHLKKPAIYVVLSGIGLFIFQAVLGIALLQSALDTSFFSLLEEQIKDFRLDAALMEQSAQFQEFVDEQSSVLIFILKNTFVSILIFSAAATILAHHLVSVKLLNQRGYQIPTLPPFKNWRWPRSILYYYLGAIGVMWLISWVPELGEDQYVMSVLLNLIPVLSAMITLQGISLVFWFADYRKISKVLPVVVLILVVVLWPVSFLLNLLGILDLGLDFRKRLFDK